MSCTISLELLESRRKPLAACVAALFALSAPGVCLAADTWNVTSCSDGNFGSGTASGTIRHAVANAVTGDTVDMTTLNCTISLLSGAVNVTQDDLTFNGPGAAKLFLTGKYENPVNFNKYYSHDRIFTHTGTGTLSLNDMTVTKGYRKSSSGTARGGCIFSSGDAILYAVNTSFCGVHTDSGAAKGGALYAASAFLKYSTLSVNSADSGATGFSTAGGMYVNGAAVVKYSTLSANSATGATGTYNGYCGAGHFEGNTSILGSTISGNQSSKNGLICLVPSSAATATTEVLNSTISGNSVHGFFGGIYDTAGTQEFYNSTIAFNTASYAGDLYGVGLAIMPRVTSMAVNMQSTIVTDNTYGSAPIKENDFTAYSNGANIVTFNAAPGHNMARVSHADAQPSDNKGSSFCALLGPLRDNGGFTLTHQLLSHSPAINNGANPVGKNEDQRGIFADTVPYLYPRVSDSIADIGAYEVNHDDIIYNAGFDFCLFLP
jgi:hypothetical protein